MQTVDWGKQHLNVIYSLVTCSENDANDCSTHLYKENTFCPALVCEIQVR